MATITKRGTRQWQAKVRKRGYPTESKTFTTKARAEEWARWGESEMDRGVFVSTAEAETTTLDDLLKRYERDVLPTKKSRADVKSRMKVISRLIGFYSAASLTPKVLAAYRDERLGQVKGHTVRKELHLIGRILRHAQRELEIGLPRGNPVDSISIPTQPKGRERRLDHGEEHSLFESANRYGGQIAEIVEFAIETGMRRGEISNLRLQDVDFKKRTATLRDTKNGEARTVALSTRAVEILGAMPRNLDGRVFSMRPDSITQAFDRVCRQVGIEDLRFHDLRHEATSRLFEMGLGIMEVSFITGHKDLVTLRRYTHLKPEDLARKLG